ncbi:MAG: CBS domain-containing protein [Dehalococcoidia bacterium]|jgi:CBS domain-containing protein|nr:CBS domain-containing protein [Dehalococcoidia bacterium]
MNVRDIMTSPVITTTADSTVEEAAQLMLGRATSCLPVLDDQEHHLVGILTHTDFGFHRKFLPMADHLYTLMGSWVRPETLVEVAKAVSSKKVKEVMSHPVVTIQEDAPIAEVADLMLQKGISRIPVIRGKELIGIVTRHDFVKLMVVDPAHS